MVKKFLILIILAFSSALSAKVQVMRLLPGQSAEILLDKDAEIKISRKSVVELVHINDDLWEVYALKSGSAVISQVLFDGSERKTIVYIEKKLRGRAQKDAGWQSFVCEEPGIQCQSSRVTGSSARWQWFLKAHHWCQENQPCIWQVRLSSAARAQFAGYLQKQFSIESQPDEQGRFVFDSACTASKAKWVLQPEVAALAIHNCLLGDQNYQIKARLYWLKHDDARRFGLNLLGVQFQNFLLKDERLLQAFQNTTEQNMLAEPMIYTGIGRKSMARVGNDSVIVLDEDHTEVLKNGILLEVEPLRRLEQRLLVTVKLEMKHPQAAGNSVDTSEFKGELWVPLAEKFIVASIASRYQSTGRGRSTLLEEIPIIAPLFKTSQETSLETRVFLELQITQQNENVRPSGF